MRRMWRLERRLKSDRPQPHDEFVSALTARVAPQAPRPPRSAWRPVLVGGLTALLLVAFAATGGVSYAAKSVQGGTTAVADLVTGPSNDSHPNNGTTATTATATTATATTATTATATRRTTGPPPRRATTAIPLDSPMREARARPLSATSRPGIRTIPRRSRSATAPWPIIWRTTRETPSGRARPADRLTTSTTRRS